MRSTAFPIRASVSYRCALCVLVVALALVVGCGGKSQTSNAGAGNSAGGVSSSGSAGNAGSTGQKIDCPDVEPAEGAACANRGEVCAGFGTLSCPDTAKCSSDGTWQIECPAMPLGPKCSCAHQLGNDAGAPLPLNHRPNSLQCTAQRAPVTPTPNGVMCAECGRFLCMQDSDCTKGANGRCQGTGPIAGLECSYDECSTDQDCPTASACECRPDSSSQIANYCTKPGTCRVDSDCGAGGFCSPSQAGQWCGTLYYCHTPRDTCINDGDCASDGLSPGCNFDPVTAHWACGGGCGDVPP